MAVLVAGLTLAGAGCSRDRSPVATEPAPATTTRTDGAPPPDPRPPLCRTGVVRVSQRSLSGEGIAELSGLVASRTRPRVLWAHNDSGDGPRIIAVTPGGRVLGATQIAGAEAHDWEDITAAGGDLYLGDIGDNGRVRASIAVYRVPEPAPGAALSAPATAFPLAYPDGAHDAEALLVDPRTRTLVVVTKDFRGRTRVYEAARPVAGALTTLRFVGQAPAGVRGITAGDVSADGAVVALRSYTELFVWRRRAGEGLARTLVRAPCRWQPAFVGEGQGEALALGRDGRSLTTVNEADEPRLRRYRAEG